jgi:hypothetical protein
VTFAAGSSTALVTVDPAVDSTQEVDETVALTLVSGDDYTIGTTESVIGTITNDDINPTITLAVSPSSVAEDSSGGLVFTFSRSGSTAKALSVKYGLGGTATRGKDYTGIASKASTNPVTFAAGSSTARLTVEPTNDTAVEPDETVAMTLLPAQGYSIGTAGAVIGTIGNDDVSASSSVQLSDGQSSLRLTGSASADAIGNSLPNILVGNAARNTLDGREGQDQLTGMAGADAFLCSTPPVFGASSADRITDFSPKQGDRLQVSRKALGIAQGERVSIRTVDNEPRLAAALSTSIMFVYDKTGGELYWNQNGATPGSGSGGVFVVFTNQCSLGGGSISLI